MTERSAVRASASIATSKFDDAEQRLLGVDDLGEDRGVHGHHDVVLRDDLLAVAGHRDLAHVDALQAVDERRDDHEAGLVGLAVLTESLDDADLALLHDVDHVLQHHEQDEHHEDRSHEGRDRDSRPSGHVSSQALSIARTFSVVPTTPMTKTGVDGGIGSPSTVTASHCSPSSRT